MTFEELKLTTPLLNAISDLGFVTPTPIQEKSFSVVSSGRDMVGIAQTGTGKTFAYMLPLLRMLPFSTQENPRILVLVPTRELVIQVVDETKKLAKYTNIRVLGVYGGTNINTQKKAVAEGQDVIIATPGRLYDLAVSRVLQLKSIQKLVIDEVDVMLDLGFRHQLVNIFDILPKQRQNILFSATMTEDVEELLSVFFKNPEKVSVALSGEPLKNIEQQVYLVPNFYTKVNLLLDVLADTKTFYKVLLFVKNKKTADLLFELLDKHFKEDLCVIHSNKTQNYRIRSIRQFEAGENRILIATDVMARGLDFDNISHVFNVDTPEYAENYIHRIGRTGRAERKGHAFVLTAPTEEKNLDAIENLMDMQIERVALPENLEISEKLTYEERPVIKEINNPNKRNPNDEDAPGPAFHEKKEKNAKENLGGSYRREIAKKYKKPLTKGDKNYNKRNKKK
ncbi:MAG: DEAD/DEAH box helicase [Flavobacteriaceae bacterium CG_4_8_14_3_um_filter_34_10]|nr:MAG: DEAD/DEAH box helicase [Flavobacteriaceae bacterium CG02_land_8_20_14_3_00_34_13]PIX08095.1 MAG: DEAD/DEAH box helicase [Flavobacteriaceae bacterium CG_4_8_14_3_um_filter_34_10]PIZ07869.1 MAG: DEAD/DEAH box helicase [Flavobacteriaceae bacterium CG_4_10_14_0_8_um_filter_34_31]